MIEDLPSLIYEILDGYYSEKGPMPTYSLRDRVRNVSGHELWPNKSPVEAIRAALPPSVSVVADELDASYVLAVPLGEEESARSKLELRSRGKADIAVLKTLSAHVLAAFCARTTRPTYLIPGSTWHCWIGAAEDTRPPPGAIPVAGEYRHPEVHIRSDRSCSLHHVTPLMASIRRWADEFGIHFERLTAELPREEKFLLLGTGTDNSLRGGLAAALNGSGSFPESMSIFNYFIALGHPPDKYVLTKIMSSAPDHWGAKQVLREFDWYGIEPDAHVFNILIKKTETFGKAIRVYRDMIEAGITPDEYTYIPLIQKTRSLGQMNEVLRTLEVNESVPTAAMLNAALMHSVGFQRRWEIFKRLRRLGCRPRINELNIILSSTPPERVGEVLAMVEQCGVEPDRITLNILMKKTGSFAKSYQLAQDALADGVRLEEDTFLTLARNACTDEERSLVDRLRERAAAADIAGSGDPGLPGQPTPDLPNQGGRDAAVS